MSETSRRRAEQKIAKTCRVQQQAITQVVQNEEGDDLYDDQLYLQIYDERQQQIASRLRPSDVDRDASEDESDGEDDDRTRRRSSMDDAGDIRLMSAVSGIPSCFAMQNTNGLLASTGFRLREFRSDRGWTVLWNQLAKASAFKFSCEQSPNKASACWLHLNVTI